jgi:hypothetical protein
MECCLGILIGHRQAFSWINRQAKLYEESKACALWQDNKRQKNASARHGNRKGA